VNKKIVIAETEIFVKSFLENETSGHDWWHINRVRATAMAIGNEEGADLFVVEMAALLHDMDDWKLSDDNVYSQKSKKWLEDCLMDTKLIEKICQVIEGVSFKGAQVNTSTDDLECRVVQDADRLDAIGAMGIARTFAYGGSRGRGIYDPNIPPVMHADFEAYKKNNTHTINHFYEKLLLLRDQMQTKTGRALAEQRHQFMLTFLDQFFIEWNGI
jgi:uncharacterized protein